MIKEVKAGLLHSASTDTNPQHSFCPKGLRSWCKYQQIEAKRQEYLGDQHMEGRTPTEEEVRKQVPSYKHQEALPPAIVELLEPSMIDFRAVLYYLNVLVVIHRMPVSHSILYYGRGVLKILFQVELT